MSQSQQSGGRKPGAVKWVPAAGGEGETEGKRQEECGPAHQDRARPPVLSTALEPHKSEGPVILQGNQLFPQLTCCPTILAGHEGAAHTFGTFLEHKRNFRTVGIELRQKAQHL